LDRLLVIIAIVNPDLLESEIIIITWGVGVTEDGSCLLL